jgi:hypothetical protein
MIDVRLTATNPEDSTLVPVPCNARGELLTVAPVIELIPNDVEIQGDLTVTGLINGLSEGPPGPPGPEGPAGSIDLPPDPYEGAVLGWQDGELAWLGGSVPLPAGTYGPFIYFPNESRLDVPQDPSALVNGQQVYMSDAAGNAISYQIETSAIQGINGNTLTFESNDPELQYFYPGLVVHDYSFYSGPTETSEGMDATALFDGSGGEAIGGTVPECGEPPRSWCPSSPAEAACQPWSDCAVFAGLPVEVYVGFLTTGLKADSISIPSFNIKTPVRLEITYIDSNISKTVIESLTKGQAYPLINTDISRIELSGTMNGSDYGPANPKFSVLLDGAPIKTNRISYTVESVDLNSMSMTLDRPGFQVGSTVFGPLQSGNGAVLQAIGETILLRQDNKQWIDGFYVTAPEQRIAARKALGSALKKRTK